MNSQRELIQKQDLLKQRLSLGLTILQLLSNKSDVLSKEEAYLTPCVYDWCSAVVVNNNNVCQVGHPQS